MLYFNRHSGDAMSLPLSRACDNLYKCSLSTYRSTRNITQAASWFFPQRVLLFDVKLYFFRYNVPRNSRTRQTIYIPTYDLSKYLSSVNILFKY